MNEQPERALLTKEEQEKFRENCDHVGTHGPVSQGVVVTVATIIIVNSHACMLCGSLFTNLSPVPIPGQETSLKPQDHKSKIIRPS